jgi:hypothetical protein
MEAAVALAEAEEAEAVSLHLLILLSLSFRSDDMYIPLWKRNYNVVFIQCLVNTF